MESAAQALQAFFPEDDDSLERQLRALDGKLSAWSEAVEVAQERLRTGGGRALEETPPTVNGQASSDVVVPAATVAPPPFDAPASGVSEVTPEAPAPAADEIDPDTFFDSPITKRKGENEDEWAEAGDAADDGDSGLIIKEWPSLKTAAPAADGAAAEASASLPTAAAPTGAPSAEPLAKSWSSVEKPVPSAGAPPRVEKPRAADGANVEDGEREELESLLASVPAEVAKRVRRMKRMNPDANTKALIERAEQAAEKQAAQEAESGGKKRGPWWRRKVS